MALSQSSERFSILLGSQSSTDPFIFPCFVLKIWYFIKDALLLRRLLCPAGLFDAVKRICGGTLDSFLKEKKNSIVFFNPSFIRGQASIIIIPPIENLSHTWKINKLHTKLRPHASLTSKHMSIFNKLLKLKTFLQFCNFPQNVKTFRRSRAKRKKKGQRQHVIQRALEHKRAV